MGETADWLDQHGSEPSDPEPEDYFRPHKFKHPLCIWSGRNPSNWLTKKRWYKLIAEILDRGETRITCPGCKRDVYITMQIISHSKKDPKK